MRLQITTLVILCALAFSGKAAAETEERGYRVVCDTLAQITQFIHEYRQRRSMGAAKDAVNAEAKTTACGLLLVGYLRKEDVKTAQLPQGPVVITRIVLMRMSDGQRRMTPVPPTEQFTILPRKWEEA